MIPNLIYDVGMHDGEDTKYYLDRGFTVIGVEANPHLVASLRETFAQQIADGRLQIVDKAIASTNGKVQLAVNRVWTAFSSINPVFTKRNLAHGFGSDYIEVEAVSFSDIIEEFGMPYYLKIDIEGMDLVCVKALHHFPDRPKYLSLETAATSGVAEYYQAFSELAELWTLGYRSFKYIDQAALSKLNGRILNKEGPAEIYEHRLGSGPFGEETSGPWLSIKQAHHRMRQLIRYQNMLGYGGRYSQYIPMRLVRRARRILKQLPSHSWYDLHARLGSDVSAPRDNPRFQDRSYSNISR
jgi:FkbM family methyltransferase